MKSQIIYEHTQDAHARVLVVHRGRRRQLQRPPRILQLEQHILAQRARHRRPLAHLLHVQLLDVDERAIGIRRQRGGVQPGATEFA